MKSNNKIKYALILLIVLLTSCFATYMNNEMKLTRNYEDGSKYSMNMQVYEGWNLIPAFYDLNKIEESSEIKSTNVKSIYVYSNQLKKYLMIYPQRSSEFINVDEEQIKGSAMWVYIDKKGMLSYETQKIFSLENKDIRQGWNFIIATPDFKDHSMDELKGNCKIDKLYTYKEDKSKLTWVNLIDDIDNENFFKYNSNIGIGLLMKVEEDCKLWSIDKPITQIPNAPNLVN